MTQEELFEHMREIWLSTTSSLLVTAFPLKSLVLYHLKNKKSITSWEAITKYHITRLSAVIYDLRHEGYDIQTTREHNEGSNYARYTLLRSKLWSEDELTGLSKSEFTKRFDVTNEEYEMLQKNFQEM